MPYSIKPIGKYFQVITTATNKVHGTHNTKADAEAQLKALYANTPKEELKKGK